MNQTKWEPSIRPEGGIVPEEIAVERDKRLMRDESKPVEERRAAFKRHNRRLREANE